MLYETTFIIDGYLQDDRQSATIARIEKIINDNKGKILKLERLGKRRLAYEIKRKQHGYYIYVLFETQNHRLPGELDREYRLNENIIRFITTKFNRHAPPPEVITAIPFFQTHNNTEGSSVVADISTVSVESANIESPSPDVVKSEE